MIPRYRAWKKAGKELGRVGQITFELDGSVSHVLFKGKFLDFNVPINEIELMQSTGLRDKNGKEIFEGDIVQFEDCYTETDFLYVNTGIVEWSQGSFTITNRDFVEMGDLLDGEFLDVTIIGNVYENPELLEEKE